MVYLTRRYRFSASHRLHNDLLTAEENARVYGKCNNPYGHGHNYALEVTLAGPINAQTGLERVGGNNFYAARRDLYAQYQQNLFAHPEMAAQISRKCVQPPGALRSISPIPSSSSTRARFRSAPATS